MINSLFLSTALASLAALTRAADDPTVWTADSRLHRSLWGMAYTSESSSYYPQCGDTVEEVVKDVQLMSQLTTRLRLYGTDCQQFELVQEAIKQTKTNLHVFAGIYIDGNETTYERQRDQAFDVLDKYGVDNILGITVGNEYLLQQNTANPALLPTAQTYLISKINEVRTMVEAKNYGKTIPVGSADAGSQITPELAAAADYIMANTHPFFSGINIEGAADWTAQYLIDEEPRYATAAGKTLYSAEIGWPTDAMAGGSLTLNGSAASIPNAQTLLDTFVCAANTNITAGGPYANGYFWFELFDQKWKEQYGGAEPFWGLFDQQRNLKDLNIPTCLADNLSPVGSMGNNDGSGGSDSNNGNSNSNGNSNNSNSGSISSVSLSNLLTISVTTVSLAFIGGISLL
ncbi:glycoside hydrolase [Serendipita vermifera]|nr:glycoside hydrolase [Serendipita vermifera]